MLAYDTNLFLFSVDIFNRTNAQSFQNVINGIILSRGKISEKNDGKDECWMN